MKPAAAGRPPDRVVLEPAERRRAVLDLIRGARARLDLSLFRCDDELLIAELSRAVQRGVDVNVIVTSRSKGQAKLRRLRQMLDGTGASIHSYGDPVVKYHAKYVVADDGPAMVASMNFTAKCFLRTFDAVVVTHDAAVVADLRQMLTADREGRTVPSSLSGRLIVGPELARRRLSALIGGARRSVKVIDSKLSDPLMLTLLQQRRQQGITVDVYQQKRIDGLKSHGKIMLIDDRVATVGSLALASLSLDFRREVAIVVEQPAPVQAIAAVFARLQAETVGDPAARSASC